MTMFSFFICWALTQMAMQKRPHSIEYNNNIRVVDNIVREVTEKISERYKNDKKTAFIFTSNH